MKSIFAKYKETVRPGWISFLGIFLSLMFTLSIMQNLQQVNFDPGVDVLEDWEEENKESKKVFDELEYLHTESLSSSESLPEFAQRFYETRPWMSHIPDTHTPPPRRA